MLRRGGSAGHLRERTASLRNCLAPLLASHPAPRPLCFTFKDIEFVEETYELKGREQHESTAMLLGRASYEAFSKVWPDLTEFADGKDSAHPGNKAMPKYVISTTLTDDDLVDNWGETIILRSLDEVARLLAKFADSVAVKRLDPDPPEA